MTFYAFSALLRELYCNIHKSHTHFVPWDLGGVFFLKGKKQINSGMHELFYSQGPCGFPLAARGKGYYGGITREAPVDVIVTRFLSH